MKDRYRGSRAGLHADDVKQRRFPLVIAERSEAIQRSGYVWIASSLRSSQ
jgi:hypothetical protein